MSPLAPTPGLAAVQSWCGWHVYPSVTETLKVEGMGGRVLLLPSLYVTNVTAIRDEDGTAVTGWKFRENGIVRGNWRCEELYEVDVVHGYDNIPADLESIVSKMEDDGVTLSALKSKGVGPFSESYGTDLESQPITVRAIIGRYRLPSRP